MSELPSGWCTTKLGQLIEFKYGKALPDRMRSGSGFPVYGSNGIVGYHNEALTNRTTIIIGRKGSVGEIHLSELPCFPIDTTYFIDEFPDNSPRYWFYQLKILNLGELNKATAIPGLNRMDAYNQDIVLAPLNEQKRITDKLDSILARVDACRERLDRIPAILKRFRQFVLAAATDGQLTQFMRENNRNSVWKNTTLSECGTVSGGLTKNAKRQLLRMTKPYLRVANVYANNLDLSDVAEIGLTETEYTKIKLQSGDLLIVEGNGSLDQLGRVAIWQDELNDCVHQNHLIRWRTNGPLPKFVLIWLLSPKGRKDLMNQASTTTGLHTLSISKVGAIPIKLPSLSEQTEIVRRVEELFAYADRIEARYQAARARVDKLTPAILAKAFRGELVPQDPNDEPASILLERIRASRAEDAVSPKPKRSLGKKIRATDEN